VAPPAAIVDIDGTLVDSNYHHAIAWYRAFRQHDVIVPIWRIHRHIGMGGDQLVPSLAGEDVDRDRGEGIRSAEKALYLAFIEEVECLPGARELVTGLKERGHAIVLASSAKADEVDHYLDLLDVREIVDGWTTSADVESTKPEPDLVAAAHRKLGDGAAVMIGDSTWDIEAATRAGLDTIGLVTGGFAEGELLAAGAAAVFENPETLLAGLDHSPLGAG
jgi:HAD superfamily hydrolase (TIGR01509 family)